MAVTQAYRDGRYAWRCEDCSRPRLEMAHRGPRKSVCKACQNKRYRRLRGDALRERNRYRMRLRRTGPGQRSREGTVVGPEQRCFPFRAQPGLWKRIAVLSPAGTAPPVRSGHGKATLGKPDRDFCDPNQEYFPQRGLEFRIPSHSPPSPASELVQILYDDGYLT